MDRREALQRARFVLGVIIIFSQQQQIVKFAARSTLRMRNKKDAA